MLNQHLYQSMVSMRYTASSLTTIAASTVLFALLLLSYLWDAPSIILYANLPLSNEVATEGGDVLRQTCFTLLLLTIVLVGIWGRGLKFLLCLPTTFVPILLWCWLSLAWAIEPGVGLRRIGFTTIIVLSIAYSVQLLSYRRVIEILLAAFVLVLLADWLALFLFPLAVHQAGELDPSLVGNWRGIHNHKNEAGAFCALCLLLLLHEAARTRSTLIGPFLVILTAVFLFETRSKTAGGFVFVSLLIGITSHIAYNNPMLRRVMVLGLLLSIMAALPFASDLLAHIELVLDDPASLTGRVQIWPILMKYVSDHPLLGSGYGSFWAIGDASPIFNYGGGWVTKIDHSHNGYLEILISTGVIGLILALGGLVVLPLYTLFFKPLFAGVSRSLICSMVAFGMLHDLLETSLLNRSNPTWVVMLTLLCLLAKVSVTPVSLGRWSLTEEEYRLDSQDGQAVNKRLEIRRR